MKISRLFACATSAVAAAGILAGCTGNALQATPSGTTSTGSAVHQLIKATPLTASRGVAQSISKHRGDWASPNKKQALLYISDYGNNTLSFYDYSKGSIGSQAGSISSGLSGPQGLCADHKGNVWVANTNDVQMIEYAHGSTSQKTTLSTSGEYPAGCSVSKKGNNLAVTGICNSNSCGQGALMVFANEQGTPQTYTCSNLYRYYFDAYDKKGNLFVDGENTYGQFGLCELPKGGSTLENISVSSPPSFPGGVQWDGKYLSIVDQNGAAAIQYSISGSTATKVNSVSLSGAGDIVQDTISKGFLIGPDAANAAVEVWKYPAGGSPVQSVTGFSEPIGSAISK